MTITETAAALFRAILLDPTDDVPRLLLADVLEEAGDDRRGEFVRVQCELATLEASDWREEAIAGKWGKDDKILERRGELILTLRRRERELLRTHRMEWARPVLDIVWPSPTQPDLGDLQFRRGFVSAVSLQFRRGFIAAVSLTCAAFMGGVCPERRGPGYSHGNCPTCHGTGRTPGVARELFLAAPITKVRLIDRGPQQVNNGPDRRWLRQVEDDPGNRSAQLPDELYSQLGGRWLGDWGNDFPTEPTALDALSAACVKFGRIAAGLPV